MVPKQTSDAGKCFDFSEGDSSGEEIPGGSSSAHSGLDPESHRCEQCCFREDPEPSSGRPVRFEIPPRAFREECGTDYHFRKGEPLRSSSLPETVRYPFDWHGGCGSDYRQNAINRSQAMRALFGRCLVTTEPKKDGPHEALPNGSLLMRRSKEVPTASPERR